MRIINYIIIIILREIKKYQKSTDLFLLKKSFAHVIREIMNLILSFSRHFQIQASILKALQKIIEATLVSKFYYISKFYYVITLLIILQLIISALFIIKELY